MTDRPLPRVVVNTGPTVPGWLLRAASALVTAGIAAIATWRLVPDADLIWATALVAAAATAVYPAATHVVVVIAGILILGAGHASFDPVVYPLLPLAYTGARLAWWAGRVSATARVELAALARGIPRAVGFIGGTAACGALVSLIAGQQNALAVVAGGAALVALAWLLGRPRTGPAQEPPLP